jgi:hypothetical protein
MTTRVLPPTTSTTTALAVAAVAGLAACGEVATPAYPGEALAILRGVVVNPAGLALPAGASAHLVWDDAGEGVGRSQLAASTTVETRLPANFSIALYTTPPPAVVGSSDGFAVARGHVVVVNDQQLDDLANGRAVEGVHGRNDRFQLVWLKDAGAAAGETARLGLPTSLTPGFHLLSQPDDDGGAAGADAAEGAPFAPVPLASIIPLQLVEDTVGSGP